MTDAFEEWEPNGKPDCPKCKGKGLYYYDDNHATVCDRCCRHDQGSWLLQKHYGENNGKWCCLGGCGQTRDTQF
jgi:hypothetical protein